MLMAEHWPLLETGNVFRADLVNINSTCLSAEKSSTFFAGELFWNTDGVTITYKTSLISLRFASRCNKKIYSIQTLN